jgi:hypothetical protein
MCAARGFRTVLGGRSVQGEQARQPEAVSVMRAPGDLRD